MIPAAYRELLRTPTVGRALGTSLLARLGLPTAGLAVVLLGVERTGSYGTAGLLSAVWVAGSGLGGLVSSRLLDRGRRAWLVLLVTAALSASGLVVLALSSTRSAPVLAAITAAAALTAPPVVPTARALWPALLPDPAARSGMYSLEATVQELTFVVGPSAAGAAAGLGSPSTAVALAGVVMLIGVALFATTPGLDRVAGGERAPFRLGAVLPLLPVFLAGGLLICGLSFVEVGVIGAAGSAGSTAVAGFLLAVWSAGSMAGGLLGGARPPRRGPARRLLVLLPAVAVANLVIAASDGLVLLGVLLVLSGALVAPGLASIYTLVQERAPAGAITQTFAGLTVSLLGGAAIGSALAGAVVEAQGPDAAFALGAVPPALAAAAILLGVAGRGLSAPTPAGPSDPARAGPARADPGPTAPAAEARCQAGWEG
ncbi:MAG TPA: MFS transporter [Mycobacteriales bacterium]